MKTSALTLFLVRLLLVLSAHHDVAAYLFVPRSGHNIVGCSTMRSKSICGNAPVKKGCKTMQMSIQPTFDTIWEKVTLQLGLVQTDFCNSYDAQSWKSGDATISGTSDWWIEGNPKFLTGVNKIQRRSNDGEELTLNIWMGPSYDVPHLFLTLGHHQGYYTVVADYIPRGMTPLGSDPQYIEKYYGDDVDEWWNKVCADNKQYVSPRSSSMASRLVQSLSPSRISIVLDSKEMMEEVSMQHVDRFLTWLQQESSSPIVARLRGSYNSRDDKLRQFYYRGELARNVAELGPDLGARVAVASTGPISEAYVGGGS